MKIQKDSKGLFVIAQGWIARPINLTTYKENDKITAKHFGGTDQVGIDKIKGKRGYQGYKEFWKTDIPTSQHS